MHNLEESITEWRRGLKSAPNLGPETLDELESHLREIVAQQVHAGVDELEAFQRAVTQLGSAAAMASEFQKLKPRVWLPVRTARFSMGFTAVATLCVPAFQIHLWSRADLLLIAHSIVIALGYVAALWLGVLGICFVCQRSWSDFSQRRLESIGRSTVAFARMAAWLVATGMVSGMVWTKMHRSAFWSWDPKEIGGLCMLLWLAGLGAAYRYRKITPRGLMVSSVLSINAVIFGWFEPNLMSAGLHSYGMINYGPLRVLEIASLLIFLVGMAPAGWLRLRRKVV